MVKSDIIKSATKEIHRQLEGIIIQQIKSIKSNKDYIAFLQRFHFAFHAMERRMKPFLTSELMLDYRSLRSSADLQRDIGLLGGVPGVDFDVPVPPVVTQSEALGAQYVLEGSMMGGPYIVAMLKKNGIHQGFTFFAGYEKDMPIIWKAFLAVIDRHTTSSHESIEDVIRGARNAFDFFILVFSVTR